MLDFSVSYIIKLKKNVFECKLKKRFAGLKKCFAEELPRSELVMEKFPAIGRLCLSNKIKGMY